MHVNSSSCMRDINFLIGAVYFLNAFFGQGTGQIVLDNVLCYGTEPRIYDCANSNGVIHSSCGHDDDASVRCLPSNISMSQLIIPYILGIDIYGL